MATPINYIIYLTDLERVQTLQTAYPTGVQIPPQAASAVYGVPFPSPARMGSVGGVVVSPADAFGWTPDLTSSYNTQTFNLTFQGNGVAVPAGFPNPYPLTIACYWVGHFVQIGAVNTNPVSPLDQNTLGVRYWVNGFEIPTLGDGGSGNLGISQARAASRTPDGMGLALRAANNEQRTETSHAGQRQMTERFYIRLRTLPVGGDDNIWAIGSSGEAGATLLLNVNTNGTLQGYFKGNTAYPGTSAGTTGALTLGVWYRVDVFYRLSAAVAPSNITSKMAVYLNGVLQFTTTSAGVTASNQTVQNSNLGSDVSSTAHGLEADIDDWIGVGPVLANAMLGYPNNGDAAISDPYNPANRYYLGTGGNTCGSHIVLVRPTGLGTQSSAAFVGDWRELNIVPNSASVPDGMTTSTPSSRLQVTSDYAPQQFGCAALTLGVFGPSLTAAPATLSIISSTLGTFSATVTLASASWRAAPAIYSVGNGTSFNGLPDLGDITLNLVTGVAAGSYTFSALVATAEMLGVFGPEDAPPASPAIGVVPAGLHNGPYNAFSVNHSRLAPISAVRVSTGLYAGNGTGQDLFPQIPCQFWFARPLSGSNSGVIWWSSMEGAHRQLSREIVPSGMVLAKLSSQNVPNLEVTGTSVQENAANTLYQYVAISDVGMRYLLAGAFSHRSSVASIANALIKGDFTPDAAFFFVENIGLLATTGSYYKGPGHTTDNASPLDAAQTAAVALLGAGSITSKTPINIGTPQTAFLALRKNDGITSGWCDIFSYIGDGTGARNIACSLGGRAPVFVFVCPHDNQSYYRDPSHTGANSQPINGALTTTAITAGAPNQFSVGATLNTNLVVYDVFVVGGSTTAFTNGVFTAVPEAQAVSTMWDPNPAPVTIAPITLNVPPQWRIHRLDLKPRREETA